MILCKKPLYSLLLLMLSSFNLLSQSEEVKSSVNFYLGASYTLTPNFDIQGIWTVNETTSARFYSLFADLIINQNLIGRAQVSSLSVSSLSEEVSDRLQSGFQMNGSLGYNHRINNNEKISIPIMATLGYSTVKDNSSRDAGMQVGGTMGLNYSISNRVDVSSSFRILRGLKFNDGTRFNQMDISFGIRLRLI